MRFVGRHLLGRHGLQLNRVALLGYGLLYTYVCLQSLQATWQEIQGQDMLLHTR